MEEASDKENDSGNQPVAEPGASCSANLKVRGKYTCRPCRRGFLSKTGLVKHQRARHMKAKRFSCHRCEFGCEDDLILTIHVETVHGECMRCRRQFPRLYFPYEPIKDEHSEESSSGESVRPTDETPIVVSDTEASEETSSDGSQPVEEPFESCSTSSEVCSSNDELGAHEKTDPNRGEHIFPQYVQNFSSNSALQTHSFTRKEERLFRCHRCLFHCKHHIALACHVRKAHTECTDCGTQFQSADLLHRHIEDKHDAKESLPSTDLPVRGRNIQLWRPFL